MKIHVNVIVGTIANCTLYISSSIAYSIFYWISNQFHFIFTECTTKFNKFIAILAHFSICFVAFIALNRIYWIRNTEHGTRFHGLQNLQSLPFTVYIVYSLQIIICHWIYFLINVITKVTGTSEQRQRKHETWNMKHIGTHRGQ